MIEALHSGGAGAQTRTQALLAGGAIGAVLAWFRDGKPAIVPGSIGFPGTLGSVPLGTLGVGLSISPLLWGIGMVVGPQAGFEKVPGLDRAFVALTKLWPLSRAEVVERDGNVYLRD